jgi:hypothetical protein
MTILGILVGALVALFLVAATLGFAIGLTVGVVRFIANPRNGITYFKDYVAAKRSKIYGR